MVKRKPELGKVRHGVFVPFIFPRAPALRLARAAMRARTAARAAKLIRDTGSRLPRRSDWNRELRRLASALAKCKAAYPVIIQDGNDKLPFATFSALPVIRCPGAGECADWCYSLHAWRYPAPYCRQLQNSLLLKHAPDVVRAAFMDLPADIVFRLYVDGDFDSAETVELWMDLLRTRPDVRAYGYSKSWDLLWDYGEANKWLGPYQWPSNYVLNLSTGGRPQRTTREQMATLPITRGDFLSLPIDYRPRGPDGRTLRGNIGYKRYKDRAYHAAVRAAGAERGLKVFSCPGKCGACTTKGPACADRRFDGVPIAIGIH